MVRQRNPIAVVVCILVLLMLIPALLFGLAWLAWWLWGYVCVAAFHWPALTYWQMFGLIVLVSIIFGGIRHCCSK